MRGIDYNPNKPYVVLSCGDDYALRYWDLQKPSGSLLTVKAHSHGRHVLCTTASRPLVLSCGTDYQVKLAGCIGLIGPAYDREESGSARPGQTAS